MNNESSNKIGLKKAAQINNRNSMRADRRPAYGKTTLTQRNGESDEKFAARVNAKEKDIRLTKIRHARYNNAPVDVEDAEFEM